MKYRPNIRVHARGFQCRVAVSGDRVFTAETTWYRDGGLVFPAQRHVLWVDEHK